MLIEWNKIVKKSDNFNTGKVKIKQPIIVQWCHAADYKISFNTLIMFSYHNSVLHRITILENTIGRFMKLISVHDNDLEIWNNIKWEEIMSINIVLNIGIVSE